MSHLLPTTLALFTPQSGGSPNADEIDSLYKIILYIALVIFVGVEGALGYALYRFRERQGAVAAQIHGNTRLEIGWTAGAALIVMVLSIITFFKLSAIQDPPNSGPGGDVLAAENGQLFATADRRLPPNGKSLKSPSSGVSTSGSTSTLAPPTPTGSAPRTPTRKWSSPRKPR